VKPLSELLPPVLMLDTSRQLHAMMRGLPDVPDGYTPGQRLIVAAVLTETAEDKTRQAEACTICPDRPDLCPACRMLTGQAASLRELAAGIAGEVTEWASTSVSLV
jgi:hypothetical protein